MSQKSEKQGKCNGQNWGLGLGYSISEPGHSHLWPPWMEQGLCSGHSLPSSTSEPALRCSHLGFP